MTRWHVEETRRLITEYYGAAQMALTRDSLRATTHRLTHAQYHFQEAKRLLNERIDAHLDKQNIITLTFPTTSEDWNDLNDCLMMVEAHMLACAQAIHSIPDTLAHVVYYALGFNLSPKHLPDRKISACTVSELLRNIVGPYAPVLNCIEVLLQNAPFQKIDALVNYTKHRGAVEPNLWVGPMGYDAPYVMRFGAFAYDDFSHPQREIEELIAPAYEAASHAVVNTGNAINHVLSGQNFNPPSNQN